MPRALDHAVLCVRDLDATAQTFHRLGFTLTPAGDHPLGYRFCIALFAGSFIEILSVGEAHELPTPERARFRAHNVAFLARGEGMSMLALRGTDAQSDAARFAAQGLGAAEPLTFDRDAALPDGRNTRFAFALAFADDPAMPGLAFFTCQQRHDPALFWERPAYQRHANTVTGLVEIGLCAADPAAHRAFQEHFVDGPAVLADGKLTIGHPGSCVTVARREGPAAPRFQSIRMAVRDLDAAGRVMRDNRVPHRSGAAGITVAPDFACGVELAFIQQGG